MNTARSLKPKASRRKAHLRGFSPDGAEVIVESNGELDIIGGNRDNYNNLIRIAKTYLAIIKENGYDISNLSKKEFSEINIILRELKEQNRS